MSEDKYLTTEEAAKEFGIPVGTLIKARIQGNGPPIIKYGNARNAPLRYKASDLKKYIEECTFNSVAEAMNRNHS